MAAVQVRLEVDAPEEGVRLLRLDELDRVLDTDVQLEQQRRDERGSSRRDPLGDGVQHLGRVRLEDRLLPRVSVVLRRDAVLRMLVEQPKNGRSLVQFTTTSA